MKTYHLTVHAFSASGKRGLSLTRIVMADTKEGAKTAVSSEISKKYPGFPTIQVARIREI